ncbi:helix-turn-helix domain-containing protein, partial [Collinsella aerofaciens]
AEVAVTQDELARDINSAREAVTRALSRLAQDGLIEVRRGRIIVRDVDGLARLA